MRVALGTLAISTILATAAASSCDAENIVTACLQSTTPMLNKCPPNDWPCLCTQSNNVLTCYNNCPNDPRRFGAEQTKESYCNAAKAMHPSSTTESSTETETGTATKKMATETGMTVSSSETGTATSGSGSGTDAMSTADPGSAGDPATGPESKHVAGHRHHLIAHGRHPGSAANGAAAVVRVNGGLVAAIVVGAGVLL